MSPAEIAASVERTKRLGRLEWNERQMSTAAKSIASSLKEIHDQKLWQDTYVSFEAYCKTKWGISRQRAYQMIGAENVRMMLADSPDAEVAAVAPTLNDGQANELAAIEPEQRVEVLKAALADPAKLTASTIKRAKARVIDAATGKPEQQEFSFTIKASPEHRENAEWFSKLAETDRANIIAAARRAME